MTTEIKELPKVLAGSSSPQIQSEAPTPQLDALVASALKAPERRAPSIAPAFAMQRMSARVIEMISLDQFPVELLEIIQSHGEINTWIALKRTSRAFYQLTRLDPSRDEKWKVSYLQRFGTLEKPADCQTYEEAYNRLETNFSKGRFTSEVHHLGQYYTSFVDVPVPRDKLLSSDLIKSIKFLPRNIYVTLENPEFSNYPGLNVNIYAESPIKKGMVWKNKASVFVLYENKDVIELKLDASHEQILKEIAEVLEQEFSHTADRDFEYFSEEIIAKSRDSAENTRIKEQQKEAMKRFARMPESVQEEIFKRMGGVLQILPLPIARTLANSEKLATAIRACLSERQPS